MFPYLTVSIFLPLITAAIVLCIPSEWKRAIKGVSMAGAVLTFAVVSHMSWLYNADLPDSKAGNQGTNAIATAHDLASRNAEAGRLEALRLVGGEEADQAYVVFNRALAQPNKLSEGETATLEDAGLLTLYRATREDALVAQNQLAHHIKFVEHRPWITTENIKIYYYLGVDGLSLPLMWLSALLTILCLAYSWKEERATKAFFALFLVLEMALIGVFAALDMFLFYVFWEIVLLPMYFLIGFWGGPRRIYAAIKFFIYTLVGSVLMLIALIVMYLQVDPYSFNCLALMSVIPQLKSSVIGSGALGMSAKSLLFIGMFVAFAIKVPVFPFHTWLPDAHVEAPTAGSVVLAGVLLKMGGYGFFRFNYTLVPEEATNEYFFFLVAMLAMIGIVYGALCAMAQKDFKSLVAYSSVSHMGYVLLGMVAVTGAGVTGAVMQMFTHGLSSAMLFLLVGVIYDRAHHRNLDDFGGIGKQMPYYTGMATIGFFAALGLPGLCGFVSEALVFVGAWEAPSLYHKYDQYWIVLVSLSGIVFGAAYILWTIQRVFMGGLPSKYSNFPDLDAREWFCLAPLGILCILVGVCPWILIDFMDPTIQTILDLMQVKVSG